MQAFLYQNGIFWPGQGGANPNSLLARGGRIQALNPTAEEAAGATRIDLRGRVAIPGPVDAHCHLVSYGMDCIREADLRGATFLAEIRKRLEDQARRMHIKPGDGQWLLGRGFEQDRLAEGRFPTRSDLDEISSEIPIRITRVCGHALVANTPALRLAGLDPEQSLPGFPQGVLTETAMRPVHRSVPEPSAEDWKKAALFACREAAQKGFVGIHSLMAHGREMRALADLAAEGPLPVRVQMQLPYSLLQQASDSGLRTGFGSDTLTIGAVKLFSDGSLGARTAALLEPYSDDPSTSGELIYEPEELTECVRKVYDAGFQVCIHAIGDRAMEVTLDAIGMAELRRSEKGLLREFPPRIEHASVVNADIVRRMSELGVAAAIQPQFAWSDYWAPERLGPERVKGCYAFKTLWDAGIQLAGSTDCPVEILDAMAALGATIHRPDWSPQEALPLEAAVRIFSEGSYALQGRRNGRFKLEDWADFVVLEHDPRRVPVGEIQSIPVVMTVVGGEVSWGA